MAQPHIWSSEALLEKARAYVGRANDAESGSSEESLWYLAAFELVARASVAKIHPVLIAEPEGSFLLYAFEYGDPQPPRTVGASTILQRCRVVVDGFTEDDVKAASGLLNLRNAELHSGDTVLEEIKSSAWLPQYYRLSELLLTHLEIELGEFFADAVGARKMIDALDADVEGEVKQRIADARRAFEDLSDAQRDERRERGVAEVIIQVGTRQVIECPACGTRGFRDGETSEFSSPVVGEDNIERTAHVLPTEFGCPACSLRIGSHAEMYYAGLGDQYTITDSEDPLEYYGIDPRDYVDASDFYEPDYGND